MRKMTFLHVWMITTHPQNADKEHISAGRHCPDGDHLCEAAGKSRRAAGQSRLVIED